MLVSGILVFALATALTGIADTFMVLLHFRILSGIGAGMIKPCVYAVVGDQYAYEKRGRAMGIVTAALISASIIGVLVGGYIAEWFTWRLTFWLIGLLSLFTLPVIWRSLPKDIHKEQEAESPLFSVFHQFSMAFSTLFLL